jgi:hypothetical protein
MCSLESLTIDDFRYSIYYIKLEGRCSHPSVVPRERGINVYPFFPVTGFSLLPSAEKQAHPTQSMKFPRMIGKGGDERKFPLFP